MNRDIGRTGAPAVTISKIGSLLDASSIARVCTRRIDEL
jgi:hypothetical protein